MLLSPEKKAPAALQALSVLGGILCIILIVFFGYAVTRRTHSEMNPEAIGYGIGTVIGVFLIPAIGVLIYAKVNKRKHVPAYLFGATCSIALLWSLFGIVPQLAKQKPLNQGEINQRVAQLAREGIGQAPNAGNKDEFDDLLRAFFADIKKFNDSYNAEVAANPTSALTHLYGADSFSSDANISLTLQQLRASLAIDERKRNRQRAHLAERFD